MPTTATTETEAASAEAGDQDDDPGRVEQVGHGQREDGDLHRVLVFGRVAAGH
jgi:hypothetical protein